MDCLRKKTILSFASAALLLLLAGTYLYAQYGLTERGVYSPSDYLSPLADQPLKTPPLTLSEAQLRVGFAIATIHNFSAQPLGTRLVGVYVDPGQSAIIGVSLIYWNQEIHVGETSMLKIFTTQGFMLHEKPWEARGPQDALDRLIATFPRFPNQTSTVLPTGYRLITAYGYPYLLGPVGITWWKNGVLFALVIRFPPSFGAQQYLESILNQMISMARSVY